MQWKESSFPGAPTQKFHFRSFIALLSVSLTADSVTGAEYSEFSWSNRWWNRWNREIKSLVNSVKPLVKNGQSHSGYTQPSQGLTGRWFHDARLLTVKTLKTLQPPWIKLSNWLLIFLLRFYRQPILQCGALKMCIIESATSLDFLNFVCIHQQNFTWYLVCFSYMKRFCKKCYTCNLKWKKSQHSGNGSLICSCFMLNSCGGLNNTIM